MRNAVYILFLFLSLSLFAKNGVKIESVSAPEFVQVGDNFSVSAKILKTANTKSIELYLHSDFDISLLSASLKSASLQKQMRFFRVENVESTYNKVYKIESGDLSAATEKIWQVNFTLKSSAKKSIDLNVSTSESLSYENETNNHKSRINFYGKTLNSGKCLRLSSESNLKIPISIEQYNKDRLLVEFWAKLGEGQTKIFHLSDAFETELFSISLTEFGYLNTSKLLDADFFTEYFVDIGNWNYFLIELNSETGQFLCYINNIIFFDGSVEEILDLNEAIIEFYNQSNESDFQIDRLKVWSYGNRNQLAIQNKNFNNYSADSSKIIYQNNFDSDNSLLDINYSGKIKLAKSTAPIFSRSPILYVSLYGFSYQLNWEVSEHSNAARFEIEKSYDGEEYESIATLQVIDNSKESYGITDVDNSENQIIYYRVKQINTDQSAIYSSEAKIGRGKTKHFKLDQNYPNPFNPLTTISLDVKRADYFEVLVYDIVGKTIAVLHRGQLNEGIHQFNFDGTDLPSGLYLCEIKSGDEIEVMKMILAK